MWWLKSLESCVFIETRKVKEVFPIKFQIETFDARKKLDRVCVPK